MLSLPIPCPWPADYEATFSLVTVDFHGSGQSTGGTVQLEVHVQFPKLLSHSDCLIIRQSILDQGAEVSNINCCPSVADRNCCLSAGTVRINCHDLFISFTIRVPLQVLPGAEPYHIPFGTGDIHHPTPRRRHQADGADRASRVNSQEAQTASPSSTSRTTPPPFSVPLLSSYRVDGSSSDV